MHLSRNLLSGTRKYLLGLILLSFISVVCLAFSIDSGGDFATARREVLLRRIGHELLFTVRRQHFEGTTGKKDRRE
ncbi:hypothetical protein [Pedobacter jeongneungensis]|uniref:hypothetical protein n=1 Tax=Pedobacter jeongneungensis TaxID=947309 RepID=UPI001F056B78|nr:hypothetical protein [Pedobacter jeongneungensis]